MYIANPHCLSVLCTHPAPTHRTAGGLVSASLLAVPGASRFFLGSALIYSPSSAKAFLPRSVLAQLGGKENYKSREVYEESKLRFCSVVGQHLLERFEGCDWGVVESGAASGSGLPPWLRGSAFTAVGASYAGGGGRTPRLFFSDTDDRQVNMWKFATETLRELDVAIDERDKQERSGNSRL